MTPVNLPLEKRAKIVQRLPWADGMDWVEIETFARFLDPFQIEKNQTLFLEGDRKPFMIILLKGQVQIFKQDSNGSMQNLNAVGPGKILGEMALVDGSPRSASAVATEATVFLRLTQEGFQKIQDEFPRLGMKIYAQIAKLLSHRLRQTSGSLVEHLHSMPSTGPAEKEPNLVGEQTILNFGTRSPQPIVQEESFPDSPSADEEGSALSADLMRRRILLTPDKPHTMEELVRVINQMHARVNKLDQRLSLHDAASPYSGETATETKAEPKASPGGLFKMFR